MRRRIVAGLIFAAVLSGPVQGQEQTLADIRQELTVLFVELQKLKRELSTTGGAGTAVAGDSLQRLDLIEGEMRRLTARTEELEFRIDRVVRDGTNRVGDLEFRLCELEPACDIATLGETPALGGEQASTATTPAVAAVTAPETTEFAIGEQGDFDRAVAALESGDPQGAATMLEQFAVTYPVGPLTSEAHFYRGEALAELGQDRDAGRAYLQSFSSAPQGRVAADALLGLGTSLGRLGQLAEACATLGEVSARFPGSPRVAEAAEQRARLGCS